MLFNLAGILWDLCEDYDENNINCILVAASVYCNASQFNFSTWHCVNLICSNSSCSPSDLRVYYFTQYVNIITGYRWNLHLLWILIIVLYIPRTRWWVKLRLKSMFSWLHNPLHYVYFCYCILFCISCIIAVIVLHLFGVFKFMFNYNT